MSDDAAAVDAWFRRRTSRAGDHPPDEVGEARRAAGLTVSAVLPALDVAATVGDVVASVVALRPALVDEVLVVDGGSSDETVAVARAAGARVVDQRSAWPGDAPMGKGDALWRGLAATTGDLVVFADTDVADPLHHLVPALLGPLVADPAVALVKACYDRPLAVADRVLPTGGGRVTELLARPLLNLWWPQLSAVWQPLAGEYAGRRSVLAALPFVTGYGVEVGLLIDVAERLGVDAIAQVDLGSRRHSHQDVRALSRMAFGIAQVVARRLGDGRAASVADVTDAYATVVRDEGGALRVDHDTVSVPERPPLTGQPSLRRHAGRIDRAMPG